MDRRFDRLIHKRTFDKEGVNEEAVKTAAMAQAKKAFGSEVDESKVNAIVANAIEKAKDTEEAIAIVKKSFGGDSLIRRDEKKKFVVLDVDNKIVYSADSEKEGEDWIKQQPEDKQKEMVVKSSISYELGDALKKKMDAWNEMDARVACRDFLASGVMSTPNLSVLANILLDEAGMGFGPEGEAKVRQFAKAIERWR